MSDTSITITEKQLTMYEEKIKKGISAFMEVGQSLQKIKEANGFKLRGFETFDDYCQATFQFSERHGYRMISAATDAKKIEAAVGEMPRNEAGVRAMKSVMHEPKLIEKVQERLKKKGGSLATATAERIEEIVEAVRPKTKTMFEPKEEKKPAMPMISDTCPKCGTTPGSYFHVADGWHAECCGTLVMIGVIAANAQACPECSAAILNAGAEFCESCGCILEVKA